LWADDVRKKGGKAPTPLRKKHTRWSQGRGKEVSKEAPGIGPEREEGFHTPKALQPERTFLDLGGNQEKGKRQGERRVIVF